MGASSSQTSINGKPIDPSVLTHNFARIAERAGLEMVQRYTRSFIFHDSPKYYKAPLNI
jgi:hypothetical protein